MTTEELKKQKDEKAAADKARFTRLAEFHKNEADHYLKKADDCDEVTLASTRSPGTFGGL
jgi:hypothetical protein